MIMKKTFREQVIDDIFKSSEERNAFEILEKKYGVKEIFDDEFETNDGGDYLDKTNKLD